MVQYSDSITIILFLGVAYNCNAFTNSFGGKLPIAARSSIDMDTKPLYAVAKPLAKEGDWNAYLDEKDSGNVYYFNTDTGEKTWTPPSETFPDIPVEKWISDNVEAFKVSELEAYNKEHEHKVLDTTPQTTEDTVDTTFEGGQERMRHASDLKKESISNTTPPSSLNEKEKVTVPTPLSKLESSQIVDVMPESTKAKTKTTMTTLKASKPKDPIGETTPPIDKVVPTTLKGTKPKDRILETLKDKVPTTFQRSNINLFVETTIDKIPTIFQRSNIHPFVETAIEKIPTIIKGGNKDTVIETPINKLLGRNIIYQEDDKFVVAKDLFEDIKEKSFKMRERIENAKTFFAGFVAGGLAVSPIVALQEMVFKLSLSEDAIHAFQFDTVFCSFQCALFAVLLRYCAQDDQKDNNVMMNSFVASSAVLRTMIMASNAGFGWTMIQHLFIGGLESYVMFAAVFATFDYGCKMGLLSRSTK